MNGVLGWFEGFVASAGLANLAIGVLLLEAALVVALRARIADASASLLVNAMTGLALMLIVRAALLDSSPLVIATLFTLAFALHLLDVWIRLRSRP